VPGAYIPPQRRRTQVVRPVRGTPAQSRRRLWWLPLLGLIPIALVGIALASGFFGRSQSTPPVASAPTLAAPTIAAPTPAGPTPVATVAPTASASPTAVATAQTTLTAVTASAAAPSPTSIATATSETTTAATASATSAVAPQTTSASAPYVAYRVQPGDSLRFIARMYGVSAASIAQASGLQNPDRLRIGQVLTIPSQPGWLYRVQPGDTLDQIAARSGIASQQIASASGLTAASVAPGQVLLIPDASAVTQQSK
jgi:LysM repeat protein